MNRVNGLTPTGDGNKQIKIFHNIPPKNSVNGLTPTGDGNWLKVSSKFSSGSVNGLTPTGDGNKVVTIMGDIVVLG